MNIEEKEFEATKAEVIQLLRGIKNNDDSKDLYNHLQLLFDTKYLLQDDEKFLDLFEDISIRIKNNGYYISQDDKERKIKTYLEYYTKSISGVKKLLEPLVKVEREEEVTPITSVGFVPDYYSIFQSLEWCGISISEKESYLLTNSIRLLLSDKNIPSARFWGKIFGKNKDYYILETPPTEVQQQEGKEPDPEIEPRGQGVNTKSYFVSNELTGPWFELEDVKPNLLRASRQIKYQFTGHLNRQVVSNPWFPGKESDLLRCQIARISHNINIIPNVGKWKVGQERELEGPIEEAKEADINDCLQLKNWVHFSPSILKVGRTVHLEKEAPEGKDPEEFKKEIILQDPFEKRLKPISEDSLIKCSIPLVRINAWKLSYCYDDKIYTNQDIVINPEDEESLKKDNSINRTIVHIRSLVWPGGNVFRLKNQIYSFYFGWGVKYSDEILEDKFVFQTFPLIQKENKDLLIGEEPNEPQQVKEVNENNMDNMEKDE